MGEKGEGIKNYKLVVTEQSWEYKVQHREQSSQRTHMQDSWTTVWGLSEGAGVGTGQRGQRAKIWDNCNITKII